MATQRAARSAAKVRRLKADVEAARAQLDSVLYDEHEAGVSIAELARQTGLTRESIYTSIRRHRGRVSA